MAKNKTFLRRIRSFFNIGTKKVQGVTIPYPAETDSQTGKARPVRFSDELLELYKYWLSDTEETYSSVKNRIERNTALQYAYYNSPIISATIDLYADEAINAESQSDLIKISGRKKVQDYIVAFLDRVGVTQDISRDTFHGIALYGDHFWVTPFNEKEGYTEVVPIDVFSVKDRLEFNAIEVAENKNKNNSVFNNLVNNSKMDSLQALIDANKDEWGEWFHNYLFGFSISNDIQLPPWSMLHFRNFSTMSEFYPFGRPILINSLAPFRQLQSSKNLMALARASSFVLKHFEVKVNDNATPLEKWEAVNAAREQYYNMANKPSGKEQFTINSEIWTPENELSVNSIDTRIDLDKIGDVELLRDDLIMGTRIPKGYLIVDRSSFGTSGQSLLKQHKPFARAVYTLQTSFLSQLTQLVRMQFALTGDFDIDEEFELSMAFPQVEESSDRIRAKNDTLRLSKDIIDNIGSAMGLDRDEALPPDVVRDILGKFSFIDQSDLDDWVDQIVKAREEQEEEGDTGGKSSGFQFNARNRVIRKKVEERLHSSLIEECILDSKKRLGMKEGVMEGRHFMTSSNMGFQERAIVQSLKNSRESGKLTG